MRHWSQYWKDRVIGRVQAWFSGPQRRLKTGMQSVLLQLELKGRLPKDLAAVELFGMHGLWHTKDYAPRVEHLDFFEIDGVYLDLARRTLKGSRVSFHHADSIAWASRTEKVFNFVVADIPYSGPFYSDDGLPTFFEDLVRICMPGGVIIFNCHASRLRDHRELETMMMRRSGMRTLSDIFYVPRNGSITYVVLCMD